MEAMASVIEIKNLTEFHIHYYRGEALEKLVKNNLRVVDIDISEDDRNHAGSEEDMNAFCEDECFDRQEGLHDDDKYTSFCPEVLDFNQNLNVTPLSDDYGYSSMAQSYSTDLLNLRPRNGAVRKIAMVESSTQVLQDDIPNWSFANEEEDISFDDDEYRGDDEYCGDECDQVKDVKVERSHSSGNYHN